MAVAAQLPLRGKRAAPVDRHPIPDTDHLQALTTGAATCGTCGRRLTVTRFTSHVDMGNGPGAELPRVIVHHTGPKV